MKRYIVNAEGLQCNRKQVKLQKKSLKDGPGVNLETLEDAIFKDRPYRIKYLDLRKRMMWNKSKLVVLQYCWDVLRWRPGVNKMITVHPNNKYMK